MTYRWPYRCAVTAVTLLALGTGELRAQATLDTTFAVNRNARLSVQNPSGSVEVKSWNRSQVRVQAEYDRARVEFDATGSQVAVRTVNRRGNGEVTYSITVPAGTAVEINGMSTDASVSGVCGPVSVSVMSGDVDVRCIDGDGQITTLSGEVDVADARGGLEVNSTSGDVNVRTARGAVTVHVTSGDVTLDDIQGTEVDAETVSGDIEYGGRLADNGRYRLAAHSGDVTLRVAGTPNATVAVETFSGDFSSDFSIELAPNTHISHQWEFKLGSGSARVRLSSFSGTINLRRGSGGNNREE